MFALPPRRNIALAAGPMGEGPANRSRCAQSVSSSVIGLGGVGLGGSVPAEAPAPIPMRCVSAARTACNLATAVPMLVQLMTLTPPFSCSHAVASDLLRVSLKDSSRTPGGQWLEGAIC